MTTLHATSTYNVEASLNAWFKAKANGVTIPLLTAPYTFEFNFTGKPIAPPCFSTNHAQISRANAYQGRGLGATEHGVSASNLMDISAWVLKADGNSWQARLRQMAGIVEAVFASPASIQLTDYTTPGTPAAVTYKVNLMEYTAISTAEDNANPGIWRFRAQIRYEWTLRTNVS